MTKNNIFFEENNETTNEFMKDGVEKFQMR